MMRKGIAEKRYCDGDDYAPKKEGKNLGFPRSDSSLRKENKPCSY